jgi:hypothetical protein
MRLRKEDADKKEAVKPAADKKKFLEAVEVPKEIVITAWYTPEIPVSKVQKDIGACQV